MSILHSRSAAAGATIEATFVASSPRRSSWLALWSSDDPGGLLRGSASLVPGDSPATATVARRLGGDVVVDHVAVRRVPMSAAIDLLAGPPPLEADETASFAAWRRAIRFALSAVARGRLLPTVTEEGHDGWRLDPLDADDRATLGALALALPPAAHAAVDDAGRMPEPLVLVRSFVDAVADAFVRTSAAPIVAGSVTFADAEPLKVPHLRPWVGEVTAVHCAGSGLAIRMEPSLDGEGRERWRLVVQFRSREDPSLLVDASAFWRAPAELRARFGHHAEADLRTGLRRASAVCSAFQRLLDHVSPERLELTTLELEDLLDHLDQLIELGVDVRWPSEVVDVPIERRLIVGASTPGDAMPTVNALDDLLEVDWQFLLDGSPLTKSELATLAAAKRPLVPIRGRWVRLDRVARNRLREGTPPLSASDALAAALGAGLTLDREAGAGGSSGGDGSSLPLGETEGANDEDAVEVVLEGAIADLVDRLRNLDGAREAQEPAKLAATLRPYQRRGLAWMSDLCDIGLGGCLADDMGLGKTIQLLSLHASRGGATLVVCPTSLVANWEREARRFLPGTIVHRYHGASRSLRTVEDGDLVITTYGVVRSDAETLAEFGWDLVVADEAQHLKNPRSRTARAIRTIPSTARLALTGTPVENRLSELWSILDWAVPGLLGPLATFRHTLATPIERQNDPRATRRLAAIVGPFLLRRRKTDPDIAPELPAKVERDVIVPLTDEQVTLYRATTEEVLADLADHDGLARHGLVLRLLTALKQITNHPAQFLGERGPLDGRSGKLAALDDLVRAARGNGEQTLVFSQYVAMGRLIETHLAAQGVEVEVLHGGLDVSKRAALVDRFQAGTIDVLVLSLKAGGTGLNLTAATQVIHYDRWWNPAVEDQATDRAHRIGQTRSVTVHRLVTEGTVEDRVAQLLANKRALADAVVGAGGEQWIGNLDDDDLAALVRLDK
ncbi:MAG: DEAD/DEAH box helicase [Acidimicrobiales bacterium]